MKRKILLAILTTGLFALPLLLAINNLTSLSGPETTMDLNPKRIQKEQLDFFEINITVTNVTNLFSFKIEFTYSERILAFKGAREGDVLNKPKGDLEVSHDPSMGYLVLRQSSSSGALPTNRSGTLATIRFQCQNTGTAILFYKAELEDQLFREFHEDYVEGSCAVLERTSTIEIDADFMLPADMTTGSIDTLFLVEANNVVLDLNGHTIDTPNKGRNAIEAINHQAFTIKNGTIKNFQYGVKLSGCEQVNISDVTILGARDIALKIGDSREIHICDNKISGSQNECVELTNCSFSKISGNYFSNNSLWAMVIEYGSNNSIVCNNTISDNRPGGISLSHSNNNIFFSNNFINNTDPSGLVNHVKSKESTNSWNSSYPRGGNYWYNYSNQQIVDEWSGKNLSLAKIDGPDGIGDSQYTIDGNNTDYYPLMESYGKVLRTMCDVECVVWCNASRYREIEYVEFHPVAIFSDSIITNFNFSTQGQVNFHVVNGTFCKMIVSKKLLDGALAMYIDDAPTESFLNSDETHIFTYFSYDGGAHEVRIEGEFGTRILEGDINRDDKVNMLDISRVAKDYDKEAEVKPFPSP